MRRFHALGVWIVSLLALSTSLSSASIAAPYLTGQSDYADFLVSWQVFAADAPDNPRPKAGEYTYLYDVEQTGAGTPLYTFEIFANPPFALGNLTAYGFIPGGGPEPDWVDYGLWGWNWGAGVVLGPGERVATMYLNSPAGPGEIAATPYWCLTCDQAANPAIGPVTPAPGPADFNLDGSVDGDDYSAWIASYGADYWPADGNSNGIVDTADYTIWRDLFSASGTASNWGTAVPEPSCISLAWVVVALWLCRIYEVRRLRLRRP